MYFFTQFRNHFLPKRVVSRNWKGKYRFSGKVEKFYALQTKTITFLPSVYYLYTKFSYMRTRTSSLLFPIRSPLLFLFMSWISLDQLKVISWIFYVWFVYRFSFVFYYFVLNRRQRHSLTLGFTHASTGT